MKVERYEKQILEVLQSEGRLSNVELSRKIGLSESPCLRKTKALEEEGYIKGYKAVVDFKKMGCQITAMVMVNLNQSDVVASEFFDAIYKEPRVIECLAITGTSDLMLRVVAKDIDDLSEFTFNGLLRNSSVKDVSSCVVLKEIKVNATVPFLEGTGQK